MRTRTLAHVVALVIGWAFILWANRFHEEAPTILLQLAWTAIVFLVYNLWRVGAAAMNEELDDKTWERPVGALAELEHEKRTLLKAIKEAEFDHEMGKLSKNDVDLMVRTYRARAIAVIKEIDKLEQGAGTVRDEIEREVKARLAMEKAEKAQKRKKLEKGEKRKADITEAEDAS